MSNNEEVYPNDDLGSFRMPGVPDGADSGDADDAGFDLDVQDAESLFITGAVSGDTLASVFDSLCGVVVSTDDRDDVAWARGNADAVLREIMDRSRIVHG